MDKNFKRKIRAQRVRTKISGKASRPRLNIFRSNRYLYVQVIDDQKGETLAAANDLKIKESSVKKRAEAVGIKIAKECEAKKIEAVVFDRGGYKYTGIIKVLAEAARKKGLKF
ncbi:50S ribosomal protein L18 [Patescibacteria group bacterium]|nr:50S ribosomal protein L18 [Patescibacteria group bacterium]